MKKKLFGIISSIIIMFTIFYFLFKSLNIENVKNIYKNINWVFVIYAIPFYVLSYFLRTKRFNIFLENKINYKELFGIVSIHNLFVNLLPVRLGEISYIKMIHTRKIKLSKNIHSLLISRIFDFIVIALLFIIFYNSSGLPLGTIYLIFSILLILFSLLCIFKLEIIIKIFEKINHLCIHNKKIKLFLREFRTEAKKMSKRKLIMLFTLSLFIWLGGFVFNYILLRGIGVNLSFLEVLIMVSILLFINMIPLYTPGGFGIVEGVWGAGLILYGINRDLAILSGLYLHVVQLALTIILGIIGWFLLRTKKINRG